MSKGKCPLCDVQWKPKSSDIWGPSITSLNEMPIKMQSHVFKPFKEASVDYTNKYVSYLNCEGVNVVKLPAIPFCNFATLITSTTYYSVSKAIEIYTRQSCRLLYYMVIESTFDATDIRINLKDTSSLA